MKIMQKVAFLLVFITIKTSGMILDFEKTIFPHKRIVCSSVSDIFCNLYDKSLLKTQALYGEKLIALAHTRNKNKSFLYVYALEQEQTIQDVPNKWVSGWIKEKDTIAVDKFSSITITINQPLIKIKIQPSNHNKHMFLLMGSFLLGEKITNDIYKIMFSNNTFGIIGQNNVQQLNPENEFPAKEQINLRKKLQTLAFSCCGAKYREGGRTITFLSDDYFNLGVDSPGLINLLYRAIGLSIPRTTQAQYELCNKIASGKNIKTGDLIFLAKPKSPNEICSVGIFSESFIIYANPEKQFVDSYADIGYLKKEIGKVKSGELCSILNSHKKYIVYLGSFLNNDKIIQHIKNKSLQTMFIDYKNLALTPTDTLKKT